MRSDTGYTDCHDCILDKIEVLEIIEKYNAETRNK